MGFLQIFKEFDENLMKLGLILGRPKVIWVLPSDDDNVGTTVSILVTKILTNDTAETISVHGPANLLLRSHKANAVANRVPPVFC